MPPRTTSGQKITFILNSFMILAYGLGGVALFFWNMPGVPEQNRKIASAVLILYAGFRTYKLFRKKPIDR